jgi:CheY-like chemotaxis protein/anti-sigma regulatory factor (Ser/Thr protein kinase)
VLEEVTSGVQLLAAKKSLKLELDVPSLGSLEYVLGDAFRLKQVLFNLLGNAIKFTEQGVIRLTVAARQHAGQVVTSFVVEDTGIGMNEEELHLIFNQFEQVGKSALNGQYGSGLGLSIVKELVEAQQGNITVQSTSGRGSRFEVVIPFAHTSELPAGVAAATPTVQPVFEGVIWLVDDDELILRLSSIIFNKYNIRHRCFNTAERLLDEPWNNEVKIIFADMRLPGISGAELCVLLRRKVPVSTQIIALTAQVLPAEKESILRGGFNDLLLKPFTETALLNAIHEPSISKPPPAFPERSILNGMVSDYQEINLILQLCHDDTTSDIKELLKAVEENRDTASLIVHRLAGRVGQLGEKKLASRLRKSEVLIRNSNEMQQYKDEVHAIIADLNSFLKTLETELETVH